MEPRTVADRIQAHLDDLTRAERQLALAILDGYPVSGLGPLAELAADSGVSVPTVARMVQKIGFEGYPAFQAALRAELRAASAGPVARHETWAAAAPSKHLLNRFTEAVIGNIRGTLGQIDPAAFDAACALVADPDRHVFIAGGRITHVLAEYLHLHLQVIRPGLTLMQAASSTWPHDLLNAADGDVCVIFDVRRYETNTLRLAEMAQARGARIVLFTDQWRSPVHRLAEISLSTRIVVPSAWDSVTATMLLLETLVASVETVDWDTTRARMEALEGMFDETRLFRKFT